MRDHLLSVCFVRWVMGCATRYCSQGIPVRIQKEDHREPGLWLFLISRKAALKLFKKMFAF